MFRPFFVKSASKSADFTLFHKKNRDLAKKIEMKNFSGESFPGEKKNFSFC